MLELRHISKSFGPTRALADVSLSFQAGEIHGLIGENGAGKSTTIRIVTGLQQPDAGEVWLDGARVSFRDCQDAQTHGIGFVNQELAVLPDASVGENIMIDKLATRRWGVIDWRETYARAAEHMLRVGLVVPPERLVRELSAAQKQLVQIAKALSANVRVLLLDEPTSSLTEHEARRLFGLLRELRGRGVAIIFVSHKLDEVLALCDRVSVLRDGGFVGTREVGMVNSGELARLMLGRTANDDHLGVLSPDTTAEMLKAEGIVRAGRCAGAGFTLHRGEILGFYGLVGSGRTELARIVIGEDQMDAGRLLIRGKPVRPRSIEESLYHHRLGYVTENRKEEGLMLHDSVETNLTMAVWPRLRRPVTRRIDARASAQVADGLIESLGVKTPGRDAAVGNLSGGNQQKVSIGKWLAADCDILIIDEPTVGVDVGAKEQIHRLIWDLAAREQKAVIVISSDLPELVRMANRILVFREQRIVGEVRDIDVRRKTYAEVSAEIAPHLA
ncbi:MAG TPA: sugar ABC transporter ATP-binding protein [Opitutaceae bacterium]|nr:sugar ABC transporter ATP-binding protein [Opitutaceae bacterium]